MSLEFVSNQIEGYVLEIDVFNHQGILLLKKGHVLTKRDINLLETNRVFSVHAFQAVAPEQAVEAKQESSSSSIKLEAVPRSYSWRIKQAAESYQPTIQQIKELFKETRVQQQVDIDSLSDAFYPMYQLAIEQKNIFHSLAMVQTQDLDNYLAEHALHTALITVTMANLIGCSTEDCLEMGKAALVHDIGKVKFAPSFLKKAALGQLSVEEQQEWQKHPRYGYELLRQSAEKSQVMLEGALYHHEHIDGSGYPSGLKENKIPLVARIIAAANLYDTLCSPLSPAERLTPYFACQELMSAAYKGYISPNIATAFVHFIVSAYIGDYVGLSNGQRGKIIRIHAHEPHLPIIQLDSGEFLHLQQNREIYINEFLHLERSSS